MWHCRRQWLETASRMTPLAHNIAPRGMAGASDCRFKREGVEGNSNESRTFFCPTRSKLIRAAVLYKAECFLSNVVTSRRFFFGRILSYLINGTQLQGGLPEGLNSILRFFVNPYITTVCFLSLSRCVSSSLTTSFYLPVII